MDRETVRMLASLSKLALNPAQEERAQAQIEKLLGYFDVLQSVDTEGVEPSPYPMPIEHRLRDDLPTAPLPQDEVLANAPAQRAGAFLVPRVVDGG